MRDHASPGTGPDDPERLTGIYGSEGWGWSPSEYAQATGHIAPERKDGPSWKAVGTDRPWLGGIQGCGTRHHMVPLQLLYVFWATVVALHRLGGAALDPGSGLSY